jgi:hypothetical protein
MSTGLDPGEFSARIPDEPIDPVAKIARGNSIRFEVESDLGMR